MKKYKQVSGKKVMESDLSNMWDHEIDRYLRFSLIVSIYLNVNSAVGTNIIEILKEEIFNHEDL